MAICACANEVFATNPPLDGAANREKPRVTATKPRIIVAAMTDHLPENAIQCITADFFSFSSNKKYDIVFSSGYIPVTGQDIKVYYFRAAAALVTPPGSSAKSEFRTLSGAEITAKSLTLIQTPTTPAEVVVSVYGGSVAFYGTDYTVSGTTLSWAGLGFDGLLAAADKLVIEYHY